MVTADGIYRATIGQREYDGPFAYTMEQKEATKGRGATERRVETSIEGEERGFVSLQEMIDAHCKPDVKYYRCPFFETFYDDLDALYDAFVDDIMAKGRLEPWDTVAGWEVEECAEALAERDEDGRCLLSEVEER